MSKPFQVLVSGKKILISLLMAFIHTYVPPFLGLDEYRPYMDAKRLEKTVPLLELGHLKKMNIFIPPHFEVWTNLETTSEHELLMEI